jgi:hypothetical protein
MWIKWEKGTDHLQAQGFRREQKSYGNLRCLLSFRYFSLFVEVCNNHKLTSIRFSYSFLCIISINTYSMVKPFHARELTPYSLLRMEDIKILKLENAKFHFSYNKSERNNIFSNLHIKFREVKAIC